MKTIRTLLGSFWSWPILVFFVACDYYEPLETPIEDEVATLQDTSTLDASKIAPDKITLYSVSNEDILKLQDYEVTGQSLEFQQDTAKHQEIWQLVKKLIPSEYRSTISELLIYSGASTKTSGFVDPTLNNLSKWQLAIAIDYAYRKPFNADGEVTFTILHELGHIITLNDQQIKAGILKKNCEGYYVVNGCAKATAHIQKFHNVFWNDIFLEHEALDKSPEAHSKFYAKYKNRFVTAYSAHGPSEDIAEIFATFVTEASGREGSSMVDEKIQMMYESSALSVIRDAIRHQGLTAKGWGSGSSFGNKNGTLCATKF